VGADLGELYRLRDAGSIFVLHRIMDPLLSSALCDLNQLEGIQKKSSKVPSVVSPRVSGCC
jgi:hypothetical protein